MRCEDVMQSVRATCLCLPQANANAMVPKHAKEVNEVMFSPLVGASGKVGRRMKMNATRDAIWWLLR